MDSHEQRYLDELKKILLENINCDDYAVFLFGGRARGRQGKSVDVDIGLLGQESLTLDCLAEIHDLINESSIPLKVDIVDFYSVDSKFKAIALKDVVIWNRPPTIKIN